MTNRTSFAMLALALLFNAAQPAHAVLSVSRATETPPAAPPAPAPQTPLPPLIAESLRRVPIEGIPVGSFGEFGQSAGDAEIAPAAPRIAPESSGLLDLKSTPEPEDATMPVSSLGAPQNP